MDRASVIANGRHSSEGGPKAPARRRIVLTRTVDGVVVDPDNANAILWNPASAPFEEAWAKLNLSDGTLAVSGGTDVFGLFLEIGYDSFFLTRADVSVPHGRPVFPGVGRAATPEELLGQHRMVLRETRLLDAATNTRVGEWVPKA
ncbi:MAG: dihydrofolate reductase [Reyranellaceae bacterium]